MRLSVPHLTALVLHFVGQGLEQGAFPGTRWAQQQRHAARLDHSADVVQNYKFALLVCQKASQANDGLQRMQPSPQKLLSWSIDALDPAKAGAHLQDVEEGIADGRHGPVSNKDCRLHRDVLETNLHS